MYCEIFSSGALLGDYRDHTTPPSGSCPPGLTCLFTPPLVREMENCPERITMQHKSEIHQFAVLFGAKKSMEATRWQKEGWNKRGGVWWRAAWLDLASHIAPCTFEFWNYLGVSTVTFISCH